MFDFNYEKQKKERAKRVWEGNLAYNQMIAKTTRNPTFKREAERRIAISNAQIDKNI